MNTYRTIRRTVVPCCTRHGRARPDESGRTWPCHPPGLRLMSRNRSRSRNFFFSCAVSRETTLAPGGRSNRQSPEPPWGPRKRPPVDPSCRRDCLRARGLPAHSTWRVIEKKSQKVKKSKSPSPRRSADFTARAAPATQKKSSRPATILADSSADGLARAAPATQGVDENRCSVE
jgi:hypothetical protein